MYVTTGLMLLAGVAVTVAAERVREARADVDEYGAKSPQVAAAGAAADSEADRRNRPSKESPKRRKRSGYDSTKNSLDQADRAELLAIHNSLRATVNPNATDMTFMVSSSFAVSFRNGHVPRLNFTYFFI